VRPEPITPDLLSAQVFRTSLNLSLVEHRCPQDCQQRARVAAKLRLDAVVTCKLDACAAFAAVEYDVFLVLVSR
jgi:hypothetical protein